MFNTVTNIDSQYNDDNPINICSTDDNIEVQNTTLNGENLNNQNSDTKTYTDTEIKKIIDNYTEDQQTEIFKIIKYYSEYYSTNNNGIFINLDAISTNCKKEIVQFINFSKKKTQSLEELENDMDKFKQCLSVNEEDN